MSKGLAPAVIVFAVATSGAGATTGDVWTKLHRPLHIPRVGTETKCPVGAVDTRVDFGKYGVQEGIGLGPAYPIGFSQPGSVLSLVFATDKRDVFYGSKWGGQKVLWFVTPEYRGPLLIRGRQLDGTSLVRFEGAGLRVPRLPGPPVGLTPLLPSDKVSLGGRGCRVGTNR